jgi:hypothetical protein
VDRCNAYPLFLENLRKTTVSLSSRSPFIKSKYYIVDVSKNPSVVVLGPFDTQKAALEKKKQKGWSDVGGAISHEVMSGQNCADEGLCL